MQTNNLKDKIDKTDLTFFTNEEGSTLLSRFKTTFKDTHLFNILVGYFRASGFYHLAEDFEQIDKVRILVGLNIDEHIYEAVQYHQQQSLLDFDSHKRTKRRYRKNLRDEIEASEENEQQLEKGLMKFIKFLQTDCVDSELDKSLKGNGKKLEIRAYPSQNIHAKVYIGRFKPEDRDYGFVVTGSSNFSESGLVANREFNVELRRPADVQYAEYQFEQLWDESVDISEDFVNTIENDTWVSDKITPYELYLKLIYEYLEEDINLADDFDPFLPEGFMNLKYQSQAAIQAKKILEAYNGVFLADVVGLGKTFITALLLQQLHGRTLVICPPVLKEYWEESLFEFGIRSFKVESLGKLEHILRKGVERYDYIVVDEAHRFRNENTQSYTDLLDICRGKKVILVTATPLNNTTDDIFSQIKLFQAPRRSEIPGIPNLEKYFANFRTQLNKLKKSDPEYKTLIKEVSDDIRNNVLRHVMVRRTRKDVMTYFKEDMERQKLTFPEVKDPEKLIYEYEGELENTFVETIQLLQKFNYARYTPLLYYTGSRRLTEFERQQQRNVGGFMKGILVKRLESSFFAFKQSISRFIESYEKFIEMYHSGTVYISKKADVYDLIENDNFDKLEQLIYEEKAQKYDSEDFKDDYLDHLNTDLEILMKVQKLWQKVKTDPKLGLFIDELEDNETLKENKIVLFTESKETGDYLYESLIKEYPGKIMFYSSEGGRHTNDTLMSNHAISRDLITSNFDPNRKTKDHRDNLKILITTDVLAEGINLHRSNVLINYDLPWNPTRVLQRAGRVNRLGSKFPNTHIFNFFPTTQSDAHLGLEVNITNKIQMFHDILGEDAKYLSDGEEVQSQQLFDTLNSKSTYEGDEEGDSELKYLEMLRTIRDENPNLFERIKKLPKKARSGMKKEGMNNNQLITFFRTGRLKKFYKNVAGTSSEITFFEAVNELECHPKTKRATIPKDYYHLLETNKQRFEQDTINKEATSSTSGGRSNARYIESRLKDKSFRNYKGFTETNDEFIAAIREMLTQGTIAKKTAQNIKKDMEKTLDPLEMYHLLEKHIRFVVTDNTSDNKKFQKREVILSGYITQ